jgi:hypothetical protein
VQKICHVKSQNILWIQQKIQIQTNAILNNSKGNLKRFTTLLLKRNIRNLIRFLQVKNNKIITLVLNSLKPI